MMIEPLSSNQISSQHRTTEFGESANMKQESEQEINNYVNKDNINFPKEKVEEIVDGMNKLLEASPTALKFEFHEKLNEYYVKIIDEKTKEIVREIPPKKMLDYYAAMTEFIGLIVDKKI